MRDRGLLATLPGQRVSIRLAVRVQADDQRGQDNGTHTGGDGDQPQARVGAPVPPPPGDPARVRRRRLLFVNAMLVVTTILLVVAMFAIWANRLLFSPENWSNTSSQLLENPDIRSATANYLVDQLYAEVNVASLIRSGLPPQLQGLAAPAAGALRNAAVQGTELALSRPRVQALWARANRAADQTFITIVNGGKGPVRVNQGAVTLDLGAILADVASRLGLPSGIAAKLPPGAANLTVFKSNQLKVVQNGGNAIQGLALWLTILVPVLYAVAILLTPGLRRRTLMSVGFAGAFAGVVVLLLRSILTTQIANSLTNDDAIRPAIRATIGIGTDILSDIAGACILIGLVLIVAAWFAGPARICREAREALAPFVRERPVPTYAIALGVMVLVFIWNPIHATGTPAGIIVFTLLALLGTEVLRRQTAAEFPNARPGATRHAIHARWAKLRERREHPRAAWAPPPVTTAEQLRQLAELREHGQLTPDEYQAAKAQLLHG